MRVVALLFVFLASAARGCRVQMAAEQVRGSAHEHRQVSNSAEHATVSSYSTDRLEQLQQGGGRALEPNKFAAFAALLLGFNNPAVMGRVGGRSVSSSAAPRSPRSVAMSSSKDDLIATSDELHANKDVDGLFDMLKEADTSDDDLAWRIARAYHDKAEEVVGNDEERERLLKAGFAIADAARERSGDGYSLKWYGILLGRLGDFLPTKEKVANSYKIKEALDESADKLPEDYSVRTALGQWCYKVAGIGFIERNAAKVLFGAPPKSSYEEALDYMLASYKLRPSKKAALFAGLCCQKLKKSEEANTWFQKCLDLPGTGEADADADRQAKEAMR